MNKIAISVLISVAVCLTYTCKDEYDFSTDNLSDNIPVNTELAIPLVNAEISIEELLNLNDSISFLLIDEDKFMTLVYNYDIKQVSAFDFFDEQYSGTHDAIDYVLDADTLDLGIKNFPDFEEFYVANPKITFTIKNYWDIPASIQFSQFDYYLAGSDVGVPAQGDFLTNSYTVNPPVSPALYQTTQLIMDTSNSNINDIVSVIPDHIIVGGIVHTNASTYTVSSTSVDSINIKIELPLDVRIKNLILSDTIEFSAANDLGSDTSKLETLRLNMIFENGFPVELNTQIYLCDKYYTVLDSIFTNEIDIPAGQMSGGLVTGRVKSTHVINVEGDKKSAFFNAAFLIAKYRYNTANSQSGGTVKFYSNYKIIFKAGAIIKIKI